MDGLSAALGMVRSRIQKARGRRLHEQNTKVSLIDPILRALGWDVGEIDQVQMEFKLKPKHPPVDYALLVGGAPKLLVEAKALGEDLDEPSVVSQVMSYAGMTGAHWIILTNGDEYRIYKAHAPVEVSEKLFQSFRVSASDSVAEEWLGLLARSALSDNQLEIRWRTQFIDRRVKRALEDMLHAPVPNAVLRYLREKAGELEPAEIRASLARARIAISFDRASGDEPSAPAAAPTARAKRAGPARGARAPINGVSVQDLLTAGLLKTGQELSAAFRKRDFRARVEPDGRIRFGDRVVGSVSTAGGLAREAVNGKHPEYPIWPTNGWTFWHFQDADGEWKPLQVLRGRLGGGATSSGPRGP